LSAHDIQLRILPGVEIPISQTMVDEVEAGELSTLGDGNYLLVEPPFTNLPDHLLPSISIVFQRGYRAVLAHPERNSSIQQAWKTSLSLDFVERCSDVGCVIQLTSGSILGRFGRTALEVCRAIVLSREFKLVIASDSHDSSDRTPGYLAEARDTVAEWLDDPDAAAKMVEDLPRVVISKE
jgi:protein-tyrosine phosphatase